MVSKNCNPVQAEVAGQNLSIALASSCLSAHFFLRQESVLSSPGPGEQA
jgi:hypothetical protein